MDKKFICHNCGSVNVVTLQQLEQEDDGDWLECSEPQNFEWKLPAGKITPVVGDPIYITAGGAHLSREQYLIQYGIDPESALKMMRGMGRAVRDSVNTSAAVIQTDSRVPSSIRNLINKINRRISL